MAPVDELLSRLNEVMMPNCRFDQRTFGLLLDALDAVPDGWAKVDGEWVRLTPVSCWENAPSPRTGPHTISAVAVRRQVRHYRQEGR